MNTSRLQTLFFFVVFLNINCFAQKFSVKDATGCAYEFRVSSKANHEVALVSAANKKCAKLEIPGTVINKGVEYTVVKVLSESLKDCDTDLRMLSFPNTVKEIEGYLFGSAMKLMGGYGRVLASAYGAGTGERPMSTITLESLRIPESVVELGSCAFVTSISVNGNKTLKAHIDELPKAVVPFTAEGYGLQKSAVTEYWEKKNPDMLSNAVGISASLVQAQNTLQGMSSLQRSAMLKMIQSNGPYSAQIMQPFESAGLTRDDVLAILKGEKVLSDDAIAASTPSTPSTPQQQEVKAVVQTPAQVVTTPSKDVKPDIKLNSDVDLDLPQAKNDNENTFAIIIANEHYQEEVPVEYACNDGTSFKMYCRQVLGIPEENIHIRLDATLNNMLAELDWISLIAKAFAGDVNIIFYYAGHGIPDEATGSAYLLPVDGMGRNLRTGYSLTELYKQLGEIPAKGVTVFMDACFSGSKRGEGMLASARGVAIKAKPQAPQGKMVVFSAAQGDETAYPFKEKEHGLFTYYLLKKLKETSGNVSLGELGQFITEQVSRKSIVANGKSQTPSIVSSGAIGDSWKSMKLK